MSEDLGVVLGDDIDGVCGVTPQQMSSITICTMRWGRLLDDKRRLCSILSGVHKQLRQVSETPYSAILSRFTTYIIRVMTIPFYAHGGRSIFVTCLAFFASCSQTVAPELCFVNVESSGKRLQHI